MDSLVGDWFPCADEKCTSTILGSVGWRFVSDGTCGPLHAAPSSTAFCYSDAAMCDHDDTSFTIAETTPLARAGDVLVIAHASVDRTYGRVEGPFVGVCRYSGEACEQSVECESGACQSNVCGE